MVIEQNKNEILIRVSKKIDIREIQAILNFLRYKELTSSHKVKQSVVDELATAINNKWLTKNKKRVGK
ncbi:MAG: hypothetical protein BroJett042_13720 [Bacteroidota bacterium]|nr:MAG: hypothetical protein BroJett042_13720 [Bacteroidota bacterium]